MANYYGESVQGLRLKKISSDIDSAQNKSENDKTCSSIFSCNLFAKSSSDSPQSSSILTKEQQDNICNMSPTEEKILLDQAPRTLALICDVIGSDEKDQSRDFNENRQ